MASIVQEEVLKIIAQQVVRDVTDVGLDSTLESLAIDSLGLVESIFAIEEAFEISVPFNANNAANTWTEKSTVATIIDEVESLIAQKRA